MRVTFNPLKREITLQRRGLDFADAGEMFAGKTFTRIDDRVDYGERRYISAGFLGNRM